jgi:Trk-type K+ transport system membrane component
MFISSLIGFIVLITPSLVSRRHSTGGFRRDSTVCIFSEMEQYLHVTPATATVLNFVVRLRNVSFSSLSHNHRFSIFQCVSAYTNTGMSLADQSMVPFQKAYPMLFFMAFLILAGNTAFVCSDFL